MRSLLRNPVVILAMIIGLGTSAAVLTACGSSQPRTVTPVAVSDDWYEPGDPFLYNGQQYCLMEFDGDIECPRLPAAQRVQLVTDMSLANTALTLAAWHYSMTWYDRYWDYDRVWDHYGYSRNSRYSGRYDTYKTTVININNNPTYAQEIQAAAKDPKKSYVAKDGKSVPATAVKVKSPVNPFSGGNQKATNGGNAPTPTANNTPAPTLSKPPAVSTPPKATANTQTPTSSRPPTVAVTPRVPVQGKGAPATKVPCVSSPTRVCRG